MQSLLKNKKGQTGGLITALVFGVASLVIGVIIALVIVSTLEDADLLTSGRTTSQTVNESGGYLNTTEYTLSDFDTSTDISVAIDAAWNVTSTPVLLSSGNYTVNSATGVVTNASTTEYPDVNFTYTRTLYSNEELSEQKLSGNYTEGVGNISDKLPTVLLVAAIVLILSVLAILVGVWQRMRMGGDSL